MSGFIHHGWRERCTTSIPSSRSRGDPEHPWSKGSLCPKMANYAATVHAPSRVLTPLLRTGPKGAAAFRRGGDRALQAGERAARGGVQRRQQQRRLYKQEPAGRAGPQAADQPAADVEVEGQAEQRQAEAEEADFR